MKYLLGTKQNMTSVFLEDGTSKAATVVSVSPNVVTAIKSHSRDGYSAVQIACGSKKSNSKAVRGHFGDKGSFAFVKEFRTSDDDGRALGDTLTASVFEAGEKIHVSALSKGKGFQGVVKRHNFSGGPRTHGQKHSEREPGSIGGGLRTRVPKGMRMPGRMGGGRITVRNLVVLGVDEENGEIFISGAVPGRRGTLLEIRGAEKA